MAVGKLRPPFADDVAHYTKMLAGHARMELIEVREDERAERRVPDDAYVSLLAADGDQMDSVGFARFIEQRRMSRRDLCFVIGGPFGLELERADHRLSLGADDAAPPAGARGAARAALPGAQDHRAGALPPLMRERSEVRAFLRRLRQLALMIALVIAAGTIGLALTEDRGIWESFQWALDTVATIGSHPNPETVPGQLVKVLLIVLGVGTLFYGLVTVTEVFVAGHLADLLAERRTLKAIEATSDHYIICGFGRVGRQVARDLRAAGARYVVIDALPENRELAAGVGVRFIEGEATEDEVLRAAGIMRARGVIACVDSDADNIFITLSARQLRPDIAIVARAASEASEAKLVHAGATRVISPYRSSGSEMARFALNPQVSGVVDVAPEYRLEEIAVAEGSEGVGTQIADIRGGAIIVGVRSADGTFHPQPPSSTVLNAGDVVMAMGTLRTVQRLESLFVPARTETRS